MKMMGCWPSRRIGVAVAQNELGLGPLEDGVERCGAHVVAFVHHDLSVVLDQRVDIALARQRLHHGDVDHAGRLGLAAADGADHAFANAKEGLQAFLPLLQQLGAVDQHQGVHAAPGDDRRRCHRLSERGRRAQHAGIVFSTRHGLLLVRAQSADEVGLDGLAGGPLVLQVVSDAVVFQQGKCRVQATARQGNVLRVVLGVADDAGLVPHRHAHGLGLVELGVLEGRKADQPIGQRLGQRDLLEVDQVGQRHGQARQGARQLGGRRTSRSPVARSRRQ
jgi:hypothetical protein